MSPEITYHPGTVWFGKDLKAHPVLTPCHVQGQPGDDSEAAPVGPETALVQI